MPFEKALELVRSLGADESTALVPSHILEEDTSAFLAFMFRPGGAGPEIFMTNIIRETDGSFSRLGSHNPSLCSLWRHVMKDWEWIEARERQ